MDTVTYTQEDYLRALYLLAGSPSASVKMIDLVGRLHLAKATVSQRLDNMKEHGLVEKEKYGPIQLTKRGWKLAEKLTYKHRIIETFLYEILGISKGKIHDEAHRLEHAVSDELIAAMAKKLGHPTQCPHGTPIPKIL